jgi:P27 family predicted phage terminase small subunit
MGRRGPSPKPTALRVLQGNPGKLRLNPNEPKPAHAPIDLKPPAWLTPAAREVWDRLAPDLRGVGLLTVVDVDVFAAYCATYERWRQAEEFVTKNGLIYVQREPSTKGADGVLVPGAIRYIQQYPQVGVAQKALLMLCKLGAELGLTPAARARIHIEPERAGKDADAVRIFGT